MSTEPRHHAVRVPATTANLGPGFDAFGLALDLPLVVRTVDRRSQRERVRTLGVGAEELQTGDDNLVWQAFRAWCDEHDVAVPDVGLVARSEIPLERGLGSSSAAIVAGLVLARALTGVVAGDVATVALAARLEGHPDNVAPALLGGLVVCATAADGSLVVRRVNPTPARRPIAFVPTTRQATTAARAVLADRYPRGAMAQQAARAGHVLSGLIGTWPVDVRLSGDLLHEPARLAVMEGAGRLLEDLRADGLHAWLSGAGPAVLCMVDADGDARDDLLELARRHGHALVPLHVALAGALACPEDGCALAGTGGCVQCPRRAV